MQQTANSQEETIGLIERELADLNRYYSTHENQSRHIFVLGEVMRVLKIESEERLVPFLNDLLKRNKLAHQFVEKSWKLRSQFNQ